MHAWRALPTILAMLSLGSCLLLGGFDDPKGTSASSMGGAGVGGASGGGGVGGSGARGLTCPSASPAVAVAFAADDSSQGPVVTGLTHTTDEVLVLSGRLPNSWGGQNSGPSTVFVSALDMNGGVTWTQTNSFPQGASTLVTIKTIASGPNIFALARTDDGGAGVGSELFEVDAKAFASRHAFYPKGGDRLDIRGLARGATETYVTGYLHGSDQALDGVTIDFDGDTGDSLIVASLGDAHGAGWARGFASDATDLSSFVGESIVARGTTLLVAGTFIGAAPALNLSAQLPTTFVLTISKEPKVAMTGGAVAKTLATAGSSPPILVAGETDTWLVATRAGASAGFEIATIDETLTTTTKLACKGSARVLAAAELPCGFAIAGQTSGDIACDGSSTPLIKGKMNPIGFVLLRNNDGTVTARVVSSSVAASVQGITQAFGETWIAGTFSGTADLGIKLMDKGQGSGFLATAP